MLGLPTVADRVAQTVVAKQLKLKVEAIFHDDSCGYRPGRSAKDAVGVCWQRLLTGTQDEHDGGIGGEDVGV